MSHIGPDAIREFAEMLERGMRGEPVEPLELQCTDAQGNPAVLCIQAIPSPLHNSVLVCPSLRRTTTDEPTSGTPCVVRMPHSQDLSFTAALPSRRPEDD